MVSGDVDLVGLLSRLSFINHLNSVTYKIVRKDIISCYHELAEAFPLVGLNVVGNDPDSGDVVLNLFTLLESTGLI